MHPGSHPPGSRPGPVGVYDPDGHSEPQRPTCSLPVDTSVAHPARVYGYWLGGKDHFDADRQAAEEVMRLRPQVVASARANRAFLDRAVSDFVVYIVDTDKEDGRSGRRDRLASFRNLLSGQPREGQAIIVAARQEIEVWALWGSRSELGVPWSEVVEERDPKERFFDPLITEADLRLPGQGRERLIARSLSAGWRSLASRCPEIAQLREDFRSKL
jgi:hypothetical protein